MRRRRRRSSLYPLLHGFTLRASPAVKHGTPPPEARVDLCGCSMPAMRRRRRRSSLCLLSTGSPFGHHPRLSMVRLRRRREWICAVAQCLQCDAARGESISVWMLLKRRGGESVYRLYAICKGGGRRDASTCSSTVPRGDTLCVTAGDAQRANPWKVDKPTLRHRRCRTAATSTHLSFSLHACSATPPETNGSV